MSNLQVTPITGLPQVNGWAQVVTHPSRLMTCVLSVSGKNANSVGKTLAEQIAHFQIEDSAQLHNSLLDLLQNARAESCSLQLACILFNEEKSVVATNSGSVFLKRNHRIGEILSSDGELKIIEGPKVVDDIFVLTTHQATGLFPELKNILHQNTENLVPQLVADLHSKENSSLSALAWIEHNPEDELASVAQVAGLENTGKPLSKFLTLGTVVQTAKNIVPSRLRKNPLLLVKMLWRKTSRTISSFRQPNNNVLGKKPKLPSRSFLILAIAFIFILASLVLWKRYQINQEIATLQPRLGELQQQFTHAQEIAESEPITARAETKTVLQGLEDLIAANQEKKQAVKKLKEEYQLVQEFAQSIAGTETQQLEPFFDLRLAEASFVANDVALGGNSLLGLDASGQRVALVDLENKQTQQIVFDNIGVSRSIAADESTLYVLAEGLHAYDLDSENQAHTKLKDQGDSDRAGTILENFATYLYVFNPEERNIYRYLISADGLSDPIGWLIDKQDLEFAAVTSMTIDGDLWLTTQSGEILKYTQGQPQNFIISNLPTPFDSPLKITTHADTEYLFVLEKNHQRLVILRKDGSFFKEIVSQSLASAEAISASQTENAVFVVSGSLVYKILY